MTVAAARHRGRARWLAGALGLGAAIRLLAAALWPAVAEALPLRPPSPDALAIVSPTRKQAVTTVPRAGHAVSAAPSAAPAPAIVPRLDRTDARTQPDWSEREYGDELADTWAQVFGPEGAADYFLRAYGDVPVHPIGRPRDPDGMRRRVAEPLDAIRRRVSDLNVTAPMPALIARGYFVSLGWRSHGTFAVMAGTGNSRIADELQQQILVAQAGHQWGALTTVEQERVARIVSGAYEDDAVIATEAWRAAWPEIERRVALGEEDRNVVGFMHGITDVRDGRDRLVLLSAGDDPEFDRLLRERELLDLELETDLARILGR